MLFALDCFILATTCWAAGVIGESRHKENTPRFSIKEGLSNNFHV